MKPTKLVVLMNTTACSAQRSDTEVLAIEELRRLAVSGNIIKVLFRYHEAELITYRLDFASRPFPIALLMRFLARKSCIFRDESGKSKKINTPALAHLFGTYMRDLFRKRNLLHSVEQSVSELELQAQSQIARELLNAAGSVAYLRTDLWFGIQSGGSVGHIAGVLNNLDRFCGNPVFLSTDVIPTTSQDLETHYIHPENRFWDFPELPSFYFNEKFFQTAQELLKDRLISFIYQRYSMNNYSGLKLARHFEIPFVLEYNGSEIWINRNWGKPLKYEALSERIEMLNLISADLIIVVSAPMKEELVARGISEETILVNPNGVDPEKYSPSVDGSSIRQRYRLEGKTVVGFIGTFGRWHGAEVLAEAFGQLLREHPHYRESSRLLMIGNGMTMPEVKAVISKYDIADACTLTGCVPQEQGPEYLAACDILASPHVPNPDGTPFFGSPTKLFEYMAMGKGIVASDLDQIGEVLDHGKTAWMVKPGDAESLMQGIKMLIDKPDVREQLGKATRKEVVEKYTWKEHTRKIIAKLHKTAYGSS